MTAAAGSLGFFPVFSADVIDKSLLWRCKDIACGGAKDDRRKNYILRRERFESIDEFFSQHHLFAQSGNQIIMNQRR